MRDLNNISFDEASFYFRDTSYEKPLSFPRISRDAVVDIPSKEGVPARISLNIKIDTVSPMDNSPARDLPLKDHANDLDPDSWMDNLIAGDDSSCGTLDYSVDTIEEEKIMNVQRALTRMVYGTPPTPPTSPVKLEPQLVHEDDKINQDPDELDVHAKRSEDDCLAIPIRWLTNLIDNLRR